MGGANADVGHPCSTGPSARHHLSTASERRRWDPEVVADHGVRRQVPASPCEGGGRLPWSGRGGAAMATQSR